MLLKNDILNKEILSNEGNIVGYVKDIEIDASSKKILSLVASTSKDGGFFSLSAAEDEVKIPIEEVGGIGDKIILKESVNDRINNI